MYTSTEQVIIPAIIPESYDHLESVLNVVSPFARSVQIDIVDGKFVPSVSWPYISSDAIQTCATLIENFEVEVDLMIESPEKVIEEYLEAGVSRVVIHLESTQSMDVILKCKEKYNFLLGLSIGNDTPLTNLVEYIGFADYVQLMGIAHIGSQGQPFDERVLERIAAVREAYPDMLISIDGSVNAESLPRLYAAGANRFVSGSAILAAEYPYEAFKALTASVR